MDQESKYLPKSIAYELRSLEQITSPFRDLDQMVKHLPTVRETQVRSLGWEDPLETEMAPDSSTLVMDGVVL